MDNQNQEVPAQFEVAVELGTEKIEKALEALGDLFITGKKVWKDKKVDVNDVVYVLPTLQKVPAYIDLAKDYKSIVAEFKALNLTKGLDLVKAIDVIVKKVEAVK